MRNRLHILRCGIGVNRALKGSARLRFQRTDVDGNDGWADNAPDFDLSKREVGVLSSQPGDR
jgi:hypothetical protein